MYWFLQPWIIQLDFHTLGSAANREICHDSHGFISCEPAAKVTGNSWEVGWDTHFPSFSPCLFEETHGNAVPTWTAFVKPHMHCRGSWCPCNERSTCQSQYSQNVDSQNRRSLNEQMLGTCPRMRCIAPDRLGVPGGLDENLCSFVFVPHHALA